MFKLFLFLLPLPLSVYGQQLYVDLSIEWKREKTYFQDSLLAEQTPYLKITYVNLGTDSIYFLKPSMSHSNVKGIPRFYSLLSLGWDYWKNNIDTKEKMNILLCDVGWDVISDSILNNNEGHELSDRENAFSAFYEALIPDYESDRLQKVKSSSFITESFVLDTIENAFVYLSPSEKQLESYNLIAFKVIGGEYDFFFKVNETKDYLLDEGIWNEKLKKFIYKEVKLPLKVKNYKLYKGLFHTNKLILSFPGCLKKNHK